MSWESNQVEFMIRDFEGSWVEDLPDRIDVKVVSKSQSVCAGVKQRPN